MARSANYFAALGEANPLEDEFESSEAESVSSRSTSPELGKSGEESDGESDEESDDSSNGGSDEAPHDEASSFARMMEESRLLDLAQLEHVRDLELFQATPGYTRGSVEYCKAQIMILHMEMTTLSYWDFVTLEGIDRVGAFTIHDRGHLGRMLDRQVDLIQHAIDHGNGSLIDFPPETVASTRPAASTTLDPEAAALTEAYPAAPANQTWQDRIAALHTYRQRLALDGSLRLARPSAALILNTEERLQMDRILQRAITTTEWWFTHEENNAQTPELLQWDEADAVEAHDGLAWNAELGGGFWQNLLENIFENGPGVPRALGVPQVRASVARETAQLTEADLVGDDGPTCGICFEDYEVGEKRSTLRCGHAFHADCISPWLDEFAKNGAGGCPYRCKDLLA